MNKQNISVQLYTTRKFQPYPPILNFIKEAGVVNLELFGLESMNIDESILNIDSSVRVGSL